MSEPRESDTEVRSDDPVVLGGDDEDFGLRVDWQSEAVQMEAAEFLVATRAQQERRLRIARDLEALRMLEQPTT
jgi:hypothetical protein